MSEATRDELRAQLAAMQRQVEQLQQQLNAQQSGSGAIAQANRTAAGAGGIAVGGDVHGNIYLGPPTTDPAAALAIYCRVFIAACRQLPLRSLDIGASDPTGNTSTVGLFPTNHAVCGAMDLAGNVWEWCNTQWLEVYEDYIQKVNHDLASAAARVLRGGSFDDDPVLIGCAYRLMSVPDGRVYDVGFRVVSLGS